MKFRQNIASLILGMVIMLPIGASAGAIIAKNADIKIFVDGLQVKTTVYGINGRNYTSVRDVAEAMGGNVTWDGLSGSVYIETPKTDLQKVVRDCKDSCVMIYAYLPNGKVSQGSGFVYNGYVITAKHVIADATRIDIFIDNSIYGITGTKVDIDTDLDVAVLKISAELPSVVLGDSDKLIEGEKLVSISSPLGVQNAVDECIYTGISYNRSKYHIGLSETNMEPGSSGGAIFNYNSEIIGMNVLGESGVNDAIPINDLKQILDSLE